MIKLVMLVGFLGSGKTTLLKRIIEEYKNEKIGVIINDFGAINVDAQIVQSSGVEMAELSNGSIFCACIKDKFVESLIEMSRRDIDYLFIEASGLADPSSMISILDGIERQLESKYEYKHSFCVVDSTTFSELSMVLPVLEKQLRYCDIVVVNKVDLTEHNHLEELHNHIKNMNPMSIIVSSSYCDINVHDLISMPSMLSSEFEESLNTDNGRLENVVIRQKGPAEPEKLMEFLKETSKHAYRIKGFISCTDGNKMVSCVGDQIQVFSWSEPLDEGRLVVISSVGIKIISVVIENISKHLDGCLVLG